MAPNPRPFQLIEEIIEDEAPQHPAPAQAPMAPVADKASELATDLLMTALKALSQRTLIALASLQTLLAIASVLFLSYSVLHASAPAPSVLQVTGLAIYAGFVLLALWLSRRK